MTIGIETISAYAVGIIVILIIFGFMLRAMKKFSAILINAIFGGALFAILNIMGMGLKVDVLNVLLVGLLGIPGVIIVVILKIAVG